MKNFNKKAEDYLDASIKILDDYTEKLDDFKESVEDFSSELDLDKLKDLDLDEPNLDEPDLDDDYELPMAEKGERVPGSDAFMDDLKKEDDKSHLKYEDDPNPTKFHEYLARKYQNIPQHDGQSIAGCERAMYYLLGLDKEIVENIKNDSDHTLDISVMHQYQEQILKDILLLKKRIKGLKDAIKDKQDEMEKSAYVSDYIKKEAAGTMKIYLSVSPFIKAICGILINSTVSAGKPFDLVYNYLKTKYRIKPREELEILEVLKDMGQPIFKDRGSMPSKYDYVSMDDIDREEEVKKINEMEEELGGVDFITNYFA